MELLIRYWTKVMQRRPILLACLAVAAVGVIVYYAALTRNTPRLPSCSSGPLM